MILTFFKIKRGNKTSFKTNAPIMLIISQITSNKALFQKIIIITIVLTSNNSIMILF